MKGSWLGNMEDDEQIRITCHICGNDLAANLGGSWVCVASEQQASCGRCLFTLLSCSQPSAASKFSRYMTWPAPYCVPAAAGRCVWLLAAS